ncbi:hypothetical protein KVT40_007001 [Elsinoe batatas]|uniref:Uncharacterized protein n=1 Tax=Elsinoe batatas TaxID=2601811 RepID=A0A8K0KXV3_9PEZI|nr:hypothetical protein KVT40_007001 [Elsinoe batatas]
MTDNNSRIRRRGQAAERPSPVDNAVVDAAEVKPSSPYDAIFKQKMIDAGVFPARHRQRNGDTAPTPANYQEMLRELKAPRDSSCSITTKEFNEYLDGLPGQSEEVLVTAGVVVKMIGTQNLREHQGAEKLFNNPRPIRHDITRPKPDFYAGAFTEELHESVRKHLNDYIIPCSNDSLPAVPNFFFEGKYGPGRPDVALLQALYDGAVGSRAIFELQNYKNPPAERHCDNNAYTMVFTYVAHRMTILSMHPFLRHRGLLCYQMTQLRSFIMDETIEQFQDGVLALRNAREFCKKHRDRLIREANYMAVPNANASFRPDSTYELALDYEKRRREVLALRTASRSSSSQPDARSS